MHLYVKHFYMCGRKNFQKRLLGLCQMGTYITKPSKDNCNLKLINVKKCKNHVVGICSVQTYHMGKQKHTSSCCMHKTIPKFYLIHGSKFLSRKDFELCITMTQYYYNIMPIQFLIIKGIHINFRKE